MGEFARAVVLTYVEMQCGSCGVHFAMEKYHRDKLVSEKGSFTCTNGCKRHFTGETDAERYKRLLDVERDRFNFQRRRADSEMRSASAYRGQVTKIKNRILKGICPFCNRHFKNLHNHMETKHPEESPEATIE